MSNLRLFKDKRAAESRNLGIDPAKIQIFE
jgi:hypothetical protein